MLTDSGNYDFTEDTSDVGCDVTEDTSDVGWDDISQDTDVVEEAIVRTELLMFDTDRSRD